MHYSYSVTVTEVIDGEVCFYRWLFPGPINLSKDSDTAWGSNDKINGINVDLHKQSIVISKAV